MQMDQNQHTAIHHPISFVSINKCKVIYEDQSGHVEKNFSNSAQARLFVQHLRLIVFIEIDFLSILFHICTVVMRYFCLKKWGNHCY